MAKYLDKEGVRQLLNNIKDLIDSGEEYQQLLVELLESILAEDKIQRISKLQGTETIQASTNTIIQVNCGFDAYEIKTVKASSDDGEFQIEILEDDVSLEILYKSKPGQKVYSNTGDVCNIDETEKKSVYLRVTNLTDHSIEVSYEIKLLNLLVNREG